MSAPGRRLLALFVLVLWIGPMCGAVGVGLHLVLDDHHRHDHQGRDADHGVVEAESSELARTASHGHHHDLDAATDHGHGATLQRTSPVRRQGPSLIPVVDSPAARGSLVAAETTPKPPPRGAPPDPLFRTHCTLLL